MTSATNEHEPSRNRQPHTDDNLAVVKRLLAGEKVDQANSGLGKREWIELQAALELKG